MFWSQRPLIIDKTLGVQASYPEANFGGNQILDPLDEKGTKAKLVGGGKKRESFPGHDASMACVWWLRGRVRRARRLAYRLQKTGWVRAPRRGALSFEKRLFRFLQEGCTRKGGGTPLLQVHL